MKRELSRIGTALALVAAMVFTTTLIGCGNKTVIAALNDVASAAQSVSATAQSVYPAGSPEAAKIKSFADLVSKLATDYAAATTAVQQLALLPTMQTALTLFESDIVPLLHVSPAFLVAIAAIDAGLRIAANHFVTIATQAQKQGAGRFAAARGIDLPAAIRQLNEFLATPKIRR
jgi:hypothetical protein